MYSESKYNELGVELIEKPDRIWFRCNQCGQDFSPNIQSGGKLPYNHWKCPNGCNKDMRI